MAVLGGRAVGPVLLSSRRALLLGGGSTSDRGSHRGEGVWEVDAS